ncbi:MAG: bifunctional diaminohydroxyphosphoribosylaminopyrimidine deaminase/5-amino-6-(5-phosphoribosylamino)uracil reductase RibD, partial [Planctomycetota bacterium]
MSTLPLLSDAAALARLMRRAVRVASRGHGGAEPNPMVGCVIATPTGETIADGHHRRCGEAHAEVDALRAAGARAKGAVAIVTLEPCAHQGRTGPCSEALADAGVAAVVYAVGDPNPVAKGGARRLAERGVATLRFPLPEADLLAAPFLKRVRTGMPWVMLKWAQSLDGRIALASGESKWISGGRSRRMVHRERGRVDAILTGIGTVLADDPQLVARGFRVAWVARRVVFDPQAETPPSAQVCDGRAPTTLLVSGELYAAAERRAASLRARGVDIIELGPSDSRAPALRAIAAAG